jgi:hypothetical protein
MDINQIKTELEDSVKKVKKSIDDFEFLIDHQEFNLDDSIAKVINQIDINREELIQKIHKISNKMIEVLTAYNVKCKQNLVNLKHFTELSKIEVNKVKSDLIVKYNKLNLGNVEDVHTVNNMIDEIESHIKSNKLKMDQYQHELKMKKSYFYEPTNFACSKNLFGELYIKDLGFKLNDQSGILIKSFNSDNPYAKFSCVELVGNQQLAVKFDNIGKFSKFF